jgi:hypothetical protein
MEAASVQRHLEMVVEESVRWTGFASLISALEEKGSILWRNQLKGEIVVLNDPGLRQQINHWRSNEIGFNQVAIPPANHKRSLLL